jgi:hypothetical protein
MGRPPKTAALGVEIGVRVVFRHAPQAVFLVPVDRPPWLVRQEAAKSDGHFDPADLGSQDLARLSYERAADLPLGCWLLRCAGSCNVLDGLGQQQVPGRRGVDVTGPVGKLDQ